MLASGLMRDMVREVTRLIHAEQPREACAVFFNFCKTKQPVPANPDRARASLLELFHWLMSNDGKEEAAQLLWSEKLFNPLPRATRDVWKLLDEANFGLLMGAGSMSKSYTMGVGLLMEWASDPEFTTVRVVGPSEEHLQANLFSHLVALHRGSTLPLPGMVGSLFIGLDRRDRRSSISGVVIPIGQNKRAGRLQGAKRFPRPQAHPVFGALSRMFIFLDELENVPAGIWSDIDNVMSNLDEERSKGLKMFGAFNPADRGGPAGQRAEPTFGWDNLDPDKHFRWTSKRGWEVLRLDALTSENVIAGKVIFPGLQTKAGVDRIVSNSGGTSSPGYWTFVRAMYPPQGVAMSIIPSGFIRNIKGTYIWLDKPTPVAGGDLALMGKSACIYCSGLWGRAVGMRFPPTPEKPAGSEILFKAANGVVVPRWALQVNSLLKLPKGETSEMKNVIVKTSRLLAVRPAWLCVDRTGHGQGVYDLLRSDWSPEVLGVNYSESATERKIMLEDQLTPREEFAYITSELWFALRRLLEFKYILFNPELETEALFGQFTSRLFSQQGVKLRVESKQDYIKRGFESPDEADGVTLCVHAARVASGVILGMLTSSFDGSGGDEEDGYCHVDSSNTFDHLDL
jgi:hypothetical protein